MFVCDFAGESEPRRDRWLRNGCNVDAAKLSMDCDQQCGLDHRHLWRKRDWKRNGWILGRCEHWCRKNRDCLDWWPHIHHFAGSARSSSTSPSASADTAARSAAARSTVAPSTATAV